MVRGYSPMQWFLGRQDSVLGSISTGNAGEILSAVSNAEDLTRGAYLIDPSITPVYSMLDKTRATNYFHEWTVDELDTPRADGVDFGSDATVKEDAFEGQDHCVDDQRYVFGNFGTFIGLVGRIRGFVQIRIGV